MTRGSEPNKKLADEAKAYIDALPDETAAGRLVTDTGEMADDAAWREERSRQESGIRDRTSKAGRQSNQPR